MPAAAFAAGARACARQAARLTGARGHHRQTHRSQRPARRATDRSDARRPARRRRRRALATRDRAFLHELVLGTLRRRGALDAALAPLLATSLDRLDRDPCARPSVWERDQILHLRVPDPRRGVGVGRAGARARARAAGPRQRSRCGAWLARARRRRARSRADPLCMAHERRIAACMAGRAMGRAARTPTSRSPARRAFLDRSASRRTDSIPGRPGGRRCAQQVLEPRRRWSCPAPGRARGPSTPTWPAEEDWSPAGPGVAARRTSPRPAGLVLDACAAPGARRCARIRGGSTRMTPMCASCGASPRTPAVPGAPRPLGRVRTCGGRGRDASRPPFTRRRSTRSCSDAPCTGLGHDRTSSRHPAGA